LNPINLSCFSGLRVDVEEAADLGASTSRQIATPSPSLILLSPRTPSSEKAKEIFEKTFDFEAPPLPLQSGKRGINGVYLIKDKSGHRAGIFKPSEEEGNRLVGDDGKARLKLGMNRGDAAKNECVAFYLGTKYGAAVPVTAFLTLPSPQFSGGVATGSLQEFKRGKPLKEFRPSILKRIFAKMPLREFHQLFFLDLLLGNTDRHAGNLLIDKNKFNKIDHGCSLTASFSNAEDYCWLKWNVEALHKPFDLSFISNFDWNSDVREIRKVFSDFSASALIILKFRMHLLEHGTRAGLTPFELAQFFGLFGAMSILYTSIEPLLNDTKEKRSAAIKSMKQSIELCIDELVSQKQKCVYTPSSAFSIVSKRALQKVSTK